MDKLNIKVTTEDLDSYSNEQEIVLAYQESIEELLIKD